MLQDLKPTQFFCLIRQGHTNIEKGMEDTPPKLECLTYSSHCQVLIYIIKKKEKEI